MSDKFTIIKSSNENTDEEIEKVYKIIRLNEIWERQYNNVVLQAIEKNKNIKAADYPQADLMKIGFAGVKYICSLHDVKQENKKLGTGYVETLKISKAKFQIINSVFDILGSLTLRNFVTIFPIRKDYDGDKWECKDYFYTMDFLSKKDWDKPIGKNNVFDLLWDYTNNDLKTVMVEYMCVMSDLYRSQTGKGIVEQWYEDMNIPTYTINEETGIIKNNQTGDIAKIKKKSHLQIVK